MTVTLTPNPDPTSDKKRVRNAAAPNAAAPLSVFCYCSDIWTTTSELRTTMFLLTLTVSDGIPTTYRLFLGNAAYIVSRTTKTD